MRWRLEGWVFLLAGTALMGAAEGLGYVDLANTALITKWKLLL